MEKNEMTLDVKYSRDLPNLREIQSGEESWRDTVGTSQIYSVTRKLTKIKGKKFHVRTRYPLLVLYIDRDW